MLQVLVCATIRFESAIMTDARSTPDLKDGVRQFWNSDPCGTRYLEGANSFAAHAQARYTLEPYIHEFAEFSSSRGMRVLEIGVGMGADYLRMAEERSCTRPAVDLSSPRRSKRARAACWPLAINPICK